MDLARNLKVESVSRLHPNPAHVVQPAQTIAEAVALMRHEGIGCVLVQDKDRNEIVGIFTERDLTRRVMAKEVPHTQLISDYMTPNPVSVDPSEPICAAIRRMESGGYRHLPVMHQGQPVGIISVKDIVRYLVEHFPATVHNQPPDPKAVPKRRDGA